MKMNMEALKALKALKLKLDEYSKENGAIAEHKLENANCNGCMGTCLGMCAVGCGGACVGVAK